MTALLLDTQVWLWMLSAPDRLRPQVRDLVQNADSDLYLSAASSWEIAIKNRLGKLQLPEPPARFVPDRLRQTGTVALAIEHEHVLRVADLPDHHRDPFDRLLIAQSQVLGLPLVSADSQLKAYDVEIVDA